MNETFLLYLFTRIDPIGTFLGVAAAISVIASIVFAMHCSFEYDGDGPRLFLKYAKYPIASALIFAVLTVLMPTQKDLAVIVGGSMVIQAAKTPEAKELSGLVYDAVKNQLEKAGDKKK